MLVASSMRVDRAPNYGEKRDAVSQDWTGWLADLGCQAVLISNNLANPGASLSEMDVGALVLPGGNDLAPRPGTPDDTAPERDRTESLLLEKAIEMRLPVFAVCRGLHVINAHFGGGLSADISDSEVEHVAAIHEVELEPPFADLAGRRVIETNSYHNQAVRLGDLSDQLRVMAVSRRDAIVEALVHPELPVLAVQWHPERPNPATAFDRALFNRLIDEGAFWKTAA